MSSDFWILLFSRNISNKKSLFTFVKMPQEKLLHSVECFFNLETNYHITLPRQSDNWSYFTESLWEWSKEIKLKLILLPFSCKVIVRIACNSCLLALHNRINICSHICCGTGAGFWKVQAISSATSYLQGWAQCLAQSRYSLIAVG